MTVDDKLRGWGGGGKQNYDSITSQFILFVVK